jgi:signal transduction histidine kinase
MARARDQRNALIAMTIMTARAPFQLRRRRLEEQLASQVSRLARKNLALEDFAALLAHDVRSTLLAALRCDEPRDGLARSLELVDSILDAVRADRSHGETGSVAACARQAVDDVGARDANLVVAPCGSFPVPSDVVRVALRNLIANAVAAGATSIHLSMLVVDNRKTLIVDDDGCGLASSGIYSVGAGLGLRLCRQLLGRFDASLELTSRPAGGARAMIVAHRVVP